MAKTDEARVLFVDDDQEVLLAARLLLKQNGIGVDTERNPFNIPDRLKATAYDAIFLDMNFTGNRTSGEEGFAWLKRILEMDPGAVVIPVTAFGDVGMAVRAIRAGAVDFVLKPWQNEKLLGTLNAALSLKKSRVQVARLQSRQRQLAADLDQPFHEMIGKARAMRPVFETIAKVAHTEANVLILGENGTGKELVARALHRASPRRDEVFMSVDIGAIAETLFESELFGHEKGAFTGAERSRAGRFELAAGGTLVLDEIGNIPMNLQTKMLQALESRRITRLGSGHQIAIDFRLICATNADLQRMVAQKQFRQDLLYRINTVEIHLPPLRERLEDVPLLADHYLKLYARKYRKRVGGIEDSALKKLAGYGWPGNVRELNHALERAVILCEGERLTAKDFALQAPPQETVNPEPACLNLQEVEKQTIRSAIRHFDGNLTKAAKALGLTRGALYRRLEKHEI